MNCKTSLLSLGIALMISFLSISSARAQKHSIDEMSLDRWAKLREVERHQMQVAEKYYRESNWKVAAAEYDKYLSLYETSDAASYALLRWSICNVRMRKQNTAIDDGFRSVIDYWPDSEDAIAASYYIGKTYKDIGQISKAKPALKEVADKHPLLNAGVFAMVALAEIADAEKDDEAKVEIWRTMTFKALRYRHTARVCAQAAERLAAHQFMAGEFDEAVRAVETLHQPDQVPGEVARRGIDAVRRLAASNDTQGKSRALATQLVGYLREQEPSDTSSETDQEKAKQLAFSIADVYRAANDDANTIKTFASIERRFGADDALRGKMAAWYRANKKYDEARQQYKKFENRPAGLEQIAAMYREEKNLESAITTYNQLVSVDAENSAKWQSSAAWTYREFRKYEQAIAIYQELLTTDVANSDKWLWEIASTYRDASKWKEAIGFFRQSDRFPSNYQEMARCHRRLKQYDEAIILYNQIAGGHKSTAPWALLQIGYTEEEANRKEKAISSFKKVCKLFPKDRYASVAHAHLQNKYKLSVTLGGAKDE
ncbi:MAG: tetratricopeptide repeat protein [Pirellulaceae bacterium]|nr:tetratricopeptide repeat protein [Pirellulaceae bacterium]